MKYILILISTILITSVLSQSNVCKGINKFCPEGFTCCPGVIDERNTWLCHRLENGVCCDDYMFPCPEGHECVPGKTNDEERCVKVSSFLSFESSLK